MYYYILLNNFALHLKLTHCKSMIYFSGKEKVQNHETHRKNTNRLKIEE